MAAKNTINHKISKSQQGQSILEFAFFMPLLLAIIYYLAQVNMAINGGIVFQQYTRARLFEMLYNHPDYPSMFHLRDANGESWQRFWIGMDKEKWGNGEENAARESTGNNPPTVKLGFKAAQGDDDGNNFPPSERQNVRVRIISFICMPPKLLPLASGTQELFFSTETNNGAIRQYYAGGFGSHVNFCRD